MTGEMDGKCIGLLVALAGELQTNGRSGLVSVTCYGGITMAEEAAMGRRWYIIEPWWTASNAVRSSLHYL